MEPSARLRNALLTTLGVLLAVVAVAFAARGSTPGGTDAARTPGDGLVDVFYSLYVLALIGGACLVVYMLVLNRHARVQAGKLRGRPFGETFVVGVVLLTLGLVGAREIAGFDGPLRNPQEDMFRNRTGELPVPPTSAGRANEFAWLPVLLTVGLVLLAVGASWYAGRARKKARGELRRGLADAVAEAVDESLDDLRAEPDPRRAVIAAYARLERVLAANGVARKPSEAPLEYLARVLASLQVGDRAARRLTDLFERAKFSQHDVGLEMKEEAIDALVTVRDELRVARALAERALREAHDARQAAAGTPR